MEHTCSNHRQILSAPRSPFFLLRHSRHLHRARMNLRLRSKGCQAGQWSRHRSGQSATHTSKKDFQPWALRCIVAANGVDPCQMYQLLQDAQGSPIAEFTMFRLPEGADAAAGATIVVPLETALELGLTIQVDDQPAKRYPFSYCNPVGCYARVGLTNEEVESYKNGAETNLSIVPIAAPDKRVQISASLAGFTAAFEASSVINP